MILANHIIGNHKLVLFVDNIGVERNSKKIIGNILSEKNITCENINEENFDLVNKTNISLVNISLLELKYDERGIFRIIQKLKLNENAIQIFAWASSGNIQSKILIPFLEHLSEMIVTIHSSELLSILTKSRSGNAKLKDYQHELLSGKTYVKEHAAVKVQQEVQQQKPEQDAESTTFKIGQYNASELEAKRNLKLPFEKM